MREQATQYLVLVRHGETLANILVSKPTDKLFYEVTGSDVEVGLTAKGLRQSRRVGRRLARLFRGRRIGRILVSPFQRINQTATAIEEQLGYRPVRTTDIRLAKRNYGQFWNITYEGVERLYPDEFQKFKSEGALTYRPPDGENYFDVFARIDDLLEQVIEPLQENLIVVTHSVVILAIQRKLEGLSADEVLRRYDEISVPNTYVRIYRRKGKDSPWSFWRELHP